VLGSRLSSWREIQLGSFSGGDQVAQVARLILVICRVASVLAFARESSTLFFMAVQATFWLDREEFHFDSPSLTG
jgi:hypothetical protein